MWNIFLGIAKGIGLIVLFWIINIFIAFVIFDRETGIWLILPSWFAADAVVYVWLLYTGHINRFVNLGAFAFLALLAGLYLLPVNANFPDTAVTRNNRISSQYEDTYAYAEALFLAVEKRWTSPVRQYLLEPHKVFFIKDARYFWNLPEGVYVDSNVQAHLYRNLLLESGRFSPQEIRVEQHFCTNSPHGVVVLQKDTRRYYADLWAVDNFENYQFGQYTSAPCDVLSGKPYE